MQDMNKRRKKREGGNQNGDYHPPVQDAGERPFISNQYIRCQTESYPASAVISTSGQSPKHNVRSSSITVEETAAGFLCKNRIEVVVSLWQNCCVKKHQMSNVCMSKDVLGTPRRSL